MRFTLFICVITLAESNGWSMGEDSSRIYMYILVGMLVADVIDLIRGK